MKEVKTSYNLFLPFESDNEIKDRLKTSLPHFNNPVTDNERLLNYQYEYLVNDSRIAEQKLWTNFYNLCERMVKREKNLKKIYMDFEDIEIKAGIACDYFMRRYSEHKKISNEVYFVNNFIAASYDAMRHAVYHPEENDFFLDKCRAYQSDDEEYNAYEVLCTMATDLSQPKKETVAVVTDDPCQLTLF